MGSGDGRSHYVLRDYVGQVRVASCGIRLRQGFRLRRGFGGTGRRDRCGMGEENVQLPTSQAAFVWDYGAREGPALVLDGLVTGSTIVSITRGGCNGPRLAEPRARRGYSWSMKWRIGGERRMEIISRPGMNPGQAQGTHEGTAGRHG